MMARPTDRFSKQARPQSIFPISCWQERMDTMQLEQGWLLLLGARSSGTSDTTNVWNIRAHTGSQFLFDLYTSSITIFRTLFHSVFFSLDSRHFFILILPLLLCSFSLNFRAFGFYIKTIQTWSTYGTPWPSALGRPCFSLTPHAVHYLDLPERRGTPAM